MRLRSTARAADARRKGACSTHLPCRQQGVDPRVARGVARPLGQPEDGRGPAAAGAQEGDQGALVLHLLHESDLRGDLLLLGEVLRTLAAGSRALLPDALAVRDGCLRARKGEECGVARLC